MPQFQVGNRTIHGGAPQSHLRQPCFFHSTTCSLFWGRQQPQESILLSAVLQDFNYKINSNTQFFYHHQYKIGMCHNTWWIPTFSVELPSGQWQTFPHRNPLLGLVIILRQRNKSTSPYSMVLLQDWNTLLLQKTVSYTCLFLCPLSAPGQYLLKLKASWCLLPTISTTTINHCQHTFWRP